MMDKNTEIRAGLLSAGIPTYAHKTTLPMEGCQFLRDLVLSKECFLEPAKGVWLYSDSLVASKARRVFYTLGKELYLSGTKVACIALHEFAKSLVEYDVSEVVDRAQMVLLLDFYERGAGKPYSDETATFMRYWIRKRFEVGKPVSFLSDTPISEVADWWPPSLVGFLQDRTISFEVKA